MERLHTDAGISTVDMSGLAGALIQLPILIAFFQAVLALPDVQPSGPAILVALGAGAAALSFLATWLGGQTQARIFLGGSALLPVIIVLWLGAGVSFYLVAFYGVTAIQSALIRRNHGA